MQYESLILDMGADSNTGVQQSKAMPAGDLAKFATARKPSPRKDIGLLAISCGNISIAQISFGANNTHPVKAMLEPDTQIGPSRLFAYCPCLAHGFDLR